MVTLTKISEHKKTKKGTKTATGATINKTVAGFGMYTLVYGTGSKRVSETMHCSESQAQARKEQIKKSFN